MNKKLKLATVLVVLGAVAGCVPSPSQYETEPVRLPAAKGEVTCQLYTKKMVYWDRAIDWPRNMTAQEADDICKDEGRRQAQGA